MILPFTAPAAISPELGELLEVTGLSDMLERPVAHTVFSLSVRDSVAFDSLARRNGHRLLHTPTGVMLERTPAQRAA